MINQLNDRKSNKRAVGYLVGAGPAGRLHTGAGANHSQANYAARPARLLERRPVSQPEMFDRLSANLD
jgi:hypothetical protein